MQKMGKEGRRLYASVCYVIVIARFLGIYGSKPTRVRGWSLRTRAVYDARNMSYPDDQVPQDILLCSDPELLNLHLSRFIRETNCCILYVSWFMHASVYYSWCCLRGQVVTHISLVPWRDKLWCLLSTTQQHTLASWLAHEYTLLDNWNKDARHVSH